MPAALLVRKATPADTPRLALTLASAFEDDPVISWVFPDEQRRRRILPAFMEFRLRKLGFPHDQIWMTADGAAARRLVPAARDGAGIRFAAAAPVAAAGPVSWLRTASVLGGLNRMEQQHPHDPPHWYLFILGAEPAAQGRGLGSALLTHVLARVDTDGMPAYLESSNECNVAFYGRHGFEVTSELALRSGPRIWPMWREPAVKR